MSGESLLASGQKLSSVIANLEKPSKFLKQLYFCCIQQEEKNQSSELAPRQAVTKGSLLLLPTLIMSSTSRENGITSLNSSMLRHGLQPNSLHKI